MSTNRQYPIVTDNGTYGIFVFESALHRDRYMVRSGEVFRKLRKYWSSGVVDTATRNRILALAATVTNEQDTNA